jgi:small subunit ribosomal protein S6
MRHYEMMVILSDELDDEGARALIGRIQTFVGDNGGTTHGVDEWGKRALAYEIAHRTHGYYAVLDLELDPAPLAELERQLKINDGVVRFKIIRPDLRIRRGSA